MPPDYPQTPPPGPQMPLPPSGPQPVTHPAYDFIMNPGPPPKKPLLPGTGSLIGRVGLLAGGLIALLILFAIFKGLVFKGPDLSGYVTVAQDQQEIIHLASSPTSGSTQQSLSTSNQNLAATIQLSLLSNQSQILTYLTNNHHKVSPKTLNLKVNSALDTQLTDAQTAGTYDQTFQSILQSQFTAYINDLKRTYQANTGKTGRALLSNLYAQAILLLSQLGTPGPGD